MRLWRKARREAGWMVIDAGNGELAAVLGDAGIGQPRVQQYAVRAAEDEIAGLDRAARELNFERYQCATLLAPGDYQIVVVDAPNVPQNELKTAMRWRVKDLLDLHIDDVTLDILDIPVPKDAPNRSHTMYAVAGRNEAIQSLIKRFEDATIPLSVIDIPETAQRNIAALYEDAERAAALLYFDDHGGLLTINYGGELYFSRRFEIPFDQLSANDKAMRDDARGRVLLELQRSLDHFERQFRSIAVAKLLIAPEPSPTGLAEYLAAESGFAVQSIDLNDVIDISGGPLDARVQWRLFHLLGASLRHEVKAL
ncbi:MAG TPA: agglutinin biogenesis protein MshI [Burkholderiales bacterium]